MSDPQGTQPTPSESFSALAALASDPATPAPSNQPPAKAPIAQLLPGLLNVTIPVDAGGTSDQGVAGMNSRYSVMGNKALW